MPIAVSCQCGKKFRAPDNLAGKSVKCPGCGSPIKIPSSNSTVAAPVAIATPAAKAITSNPAVARPSAPKPAASAAKIAAGTQPSLKPASDADDGLLGFANDSEVFQPAPAVPQASAAARSAPSPAAGVPPVSKSKRPTSTGVTPSIALSPKVITLIVLAILIPAAIFWAKQGPIKAVHQWQDMEPKAEDVCMDLVTRMLVDEYEKMGFDASKPTLLPKATTVFFDSPVMMISLPETIKFQGSSTAGKFHGLYYTRTGKVECDADCSNGVAHLEGNETDGKIHLSVNGRTVFP